MTISPTARSAYPLGTRPTGTAVGTRLTSPRIMVIGDSNVWSAGYSTSATGDCWMLPLHQKLVASGISPTWVGNLTQGTAPANKHRGVPGSTIATHRAGSTYDSVQFITTYTPDVCIVALGTNDSNSDTDRDNADANLTGLATEIMTVRPATNRFLLCQMYGMSDTTKMARLAVINGTKVPAAKTAIETAGGIVAIADLQVLKPKGHLNPNESPSELHLTDPAYALVADRMFPALLNLLGCNAVWVGDAA